MRAALLFLLLLPMLSASAAIAVPAGATTDNTVEVAVLEAENRLLRAELEIARQQKIYFLVDLHEEKIRIKASGIPVADLALMGVRHWGPLSAGVRRTLETKDALFAPERKRIEIPDKEEAAEEAPKPFELQALEVTDMPTAFHARLDDGTRLTVRPAPAGFLAHAWETVHVAFWYLTRPLISDWYFLRGKSYTEIRLTMPAADAQLFYWALHEKAVCLIGGSVATTAGN